MRTKVIGLTGGIGSGKTTIAKLFESWGVPVYIADDEARKIFNTPGAIKEVKDAFGEEILTGGIPDRKKLAAIVFNDPQKLAILNSIIHPMVTEHFKNWLSKHEGHNFVIREAAILFESGSYKDCDKIILVTAPKEVRIQRVMGRDNVSEDKVLERMANQWDDEKKKELSDYVIDNTQLEEAKHQSMKILKILKEM